MTVHLQKSVTWAAVNASLTTNKVLDSLKRNNNFSRHSKAKETHDAVCNNFHNFEEYYVYQQPACDCILSDKMINANKSDIYAWHTCTLHVLARLHVHVLLILF